MIKIPLFLLRGILLAVISSSYALAGPADYVYTPMVEFGEREIDIKYGSSSLPGGIQNQATGIGYGMGVTEYWFTEVAFKYKSKGGKDVSQAEWENKFQLTEIGEYAVDVGLITEVEIPLSANEAWEAKAGGLFQTEFQKLQLNGNLLFKRKFGLAGHSYNTNLFYQLQAKYRLQSTFEFGVQGFGEMGKWNGWGNQSNLDHFFGPALFGKLNLDNRRAVKYNAAWLFAASRNAPGNTFRMQIEYEFY